MDTFKEYLSGTYWRKTFFSPETFKTLLSALGFFWLLTEIAAFIQESWKADLQSGWKIFFLVSVAYTIWDRRPIVVVWDRINGSDIKIEIRIADIFCVKAAYVISTNTSFDTVVNETVISAASLQGKFTNKYYDKIAHLDAEIDDSIKDENVLSTRKSRVGGKESLYGVGTVAKVCPRGQTAYLVAIAELNEHGIAQSSFENVKVSLAALWGYISARGGYDQIAIPVLGTGHGRINIPRETVVKEIIKSFIAACSERKFASMLTVVISPKDYHENGIDIHELEEFVRYSCRYAEINPNVGRGAGTPIS